MIEGYEIKDGKVKANIDNIDIIEYDYQTNIDEIFIKENIIEKLVFDIFNKKCDKIQNIHKFNDNYSKKVLIHNLILTTTLFATIWFCVLPKMLIAALGASIASSLLINGVAFLLDIVPKNKLKKKINADTLEIEQLEEMLQKEKKKLEELKNNKSKDILLDKSNSFKENSNNKLKEIERLKNIYRICGYYAKELVKYQEKGILREKMDESFTNEDLNIIENIIREKGPQLTKKRNF